MTCDISGTDQGIPPANHIVWTDSEGTVLNNVSVSDGDWEPESYNVTESGDYVCYPGNVIGPGWQSNPVTVKIEGDAIVII